ncbi:MAG: hypothetical protein NTX45_25980 [Proteobacteria bacterium]|nr:hypothetical protein [Pseudomonadota bacterium]
MGQALVTVECLVGRLAALEMQGDLARTPMECHPQPQDKTERDGDHRRQPD